MFGFTALWESLFHYKIEYGHVCGGTRSGNRVRVEKVDTEPLKLLVNNDVGKQITCIGETALRIYAKRLFSYIGGAFSHMEAPIFYLSQ